MPSFSVTRFQELHSDEVHEIITRPPIWLARWGITMFFCFLLLIAAGTWWVKYPDIVPAGFSLTAVDGPRPVIVKADGRLESLLVADGQSVVLGQPIAYSESTADHNQVMTLERDVTTVKALVAGNHWQQAAVFDPAPFVDLGEVQGVFSSFVKELRELRTVSRISFTTTTKTCSIWKSFWKSKCPFKKGSLN
jgi:HlyD family secretion protein